MEYDLCPLSIFHDSSHKSINIFLDLTFEFINAILKCHHSNESYIDQAILSHTKIFSLFGREHLIKSILVTKGQECYTLCDCAGYTFAEKEFPDRLLM